MGSLLTVAGEASTPGQRRTFGPRPAWSPSRPHLSARPPAHHTQGTRENPEPLSSRPHYRRTATRYRAANRANWDERAPVHAAAAFYDLAAFADPGHLSPVVIFDRPLLGYLTGLRGVHLQCHLGTDTVSLARLGARLVLEHPYFEQEEPLVIDDTGTYLDADAVLGHSTTLQWNHGLGEIVTALLEAGLTITGLTEHDSVPWESLPGHMTRLPGGEWRITDRPERLPHSYTVQAVSV